MIQPILSLETGPPAPFLHRKENKVNMMMTVIRKNVMIMMTLANVKTVVNVAMMIIKR
jgi:hypothetical protein